MIPKRKMLSFIIPIFLLLSGLLSACQNGLTDQVQACSQKFLPVVKTLEPVQTSSQLVYATNGYDLYAFNAGNGVPRWCQTISAGNSKDTLTGLLYNHGSVYAYSMAGDLTSFNAGSGAVSWSTNVGYFSADNSTPPSIVNTAIYGGSKSIYALNTQDGSVRWQYSLPDQAYMTSTLVTSNGGVYFSVNPKGSPEQIDASDAATGNKRWAFSLPKNEAIFGQPIAGEGIVAFPYQGFFPDRVIHEGLDVLDAQSGKLLWQKAIGLTMSGPGGNESSAVVNGVLYVIGTFPDNSVDSVTSLYAFDAHTGTLRWSIPDSDFNGSLLVNNNVLYSVYNRGDVNALNAQTGQLLWHTQLPIGPDYVGRLVLINDHLFLGIENADQTSTYFLRALNIHTHKEDWVANISGDTNTSDFAMVSIAA